MAVDPVGGAVLPWRDSVDYSRQDLYYALVGGIGGVSPSPMIFHSGQTSGAGIESGNDGYGNTSHRDWWHVFLPFTLCARPRGARCSLTTELQSRLEVRGWAGDLPLRSRPRREAALVRGAVPVVRPNGTPGALCRGTFLGPGMARQDRRGRGDGGCGSRRSDDSPPSPKRRPTEERDWIVLEGPGGKPGPPPRAGGRGIPSARCVSCWRVAWCTHRRSRRC